MVISGFLKNTFIDYPGHIACIIFTNGCNFNCWYCHNRQLIDGKYKKTITEEEIFKYIEANKKMLDGVVVSGGEPTLHKDLIGFISKIKKLDLDVKLDTNGTNPKLLKKLIDEKLVDYVAMDYKNSIKNYKKTICSNIDLTSVKESIKLLLNSEVQYEFRTTFSPEISLEDIKKIVIDIKGANKYAIQKYIPQTDDMTVHKYEDFEVAKNIAKEYIDNVEIRGY